jgi:hypothetical protein
MTGLPAMAKHDRTLEAIFRKPTLGTIAWKDVEALLVSLGGSIHEGSGSRVRVMLNGVVRSFHRPHPRKETSRGAVESVREFLESAGFGE